MWFDCTPDRSGKLIIPLSFPCPVNSRASVLSETLLIPVSTSVETFRSVLDPVGVRMFFFYANQVDPSPKVLVHT